MWRDSSINKYNLFLEVVFVCFPHIHQSLAQSIFNVETKHKAGPYARPVVQKIP